MNEGRVVFLNGTSSSGKTSIAKELQHILETPYLHMSLDDFTSMLAPQHMAIGESNIVFDRTILGFHRSIRAMASVGNNVIVDHVLQHQLLLLDCVEVLAMLDVIFVGVHCPLPELERREQARGDRPIGLAAYQLDRVHAHGLYDVTCDTSTDTPKACASKIRDVVERNPQPRAFHQLKEILA